MAESLIEEYEALVRHGKVAQARTAAISQDIQGSTNADWSVLCSFVSVRRRQP